MFDGYTFFAHVNPIQSGLAGYILNEKGTIVAYVKLGGKIIDKETEERRENDEGETQKN